MQHATTRDTKTYLPLCLLAIFGTTEGISVAHVTPPIAGVSRQLHGGNVHKTQARGRGTTVVAKSTVKMAFQIGQALQEVLQCLCEKEGRQRRKTEEAVHLVALVLRMQIPRAA